MASKEAVPSKLAAALDLAARGFWIFPIKAGAKLPPKVKFKEAATRDEEVIRGWWGLPHHQPNIGIYTGRFSNNEALAVLDIDPKNGGDDTLFALEMGGKDLPPTFTQATPSGGRHFVYRVPSALRQGTNVFGPGIDIRSRGGYIVGCGSTLTAWPEGYSLARDDVVAVCPGWVSAALARPSSARKNESGARSAEGRRASTGSSTSKAATWLGAQPPAIQGVAGDAATFAVCAGLLDYGLTNEEAFKLLWSHWNPRSDPPWGPDELRTKIDNANAYRGSPIGSALPTFPPVGVSILAEPNAAPDTSDRAGENALEDSGGKPNVCVSVRTPPSGPGVVITMNGARPGKKSLSAMVSDYMVRD
jgi:hypothetical protein